MANLRDRNRKTPIDPVQRRRELKAKMIERNAEEKASRPKKKKKKPLGQAKPGGMSAIKKGGMTPADYANLRKKGPAKY